MSVTAPVVLSYREARDELAHIRDRFRDEADASIVYFGAHRRPEAAIVPISVVEQLLTRLDDAEIAEIVRERRAMDEEPLADVAARFGIDLNSL